MLRLGSVALTVGTRELLVGLTCTSARSSGSDWWGPTAPVRQACLRLWSVSSIQRPARSTAGDPAWLSSAEAVSGSRPRSGTKRRRRCIASASWRRTTVSQRPRWPQGTRRQERLGDATEALRLAGGFAVEERIGSVLHGLGFGPDTGSGRDTFSGGWQMRIALARLLLRTPTRCSMSPPTTSTLPHALAGQIHRGVRAICGGGQP